MQTPITTAHHQCDRGSCLALRVHRAHHSTALAAPKQCPAQLPDQQVCSTEPCWGSQIPMDPMEGSAASNTDPQQWVCDCPQLGEHTACPWDLAWEWKSLREGGEPWGETKGFVVAEPRRFLPTAAISQPFYFLFFSFMFGEMKLRETLKQTHLEEEEKKNNQNISLSKC